MTPMLYCNGFLPDFGRINWAHPELIPALKLEDYVVSFQELFVPAVSTTAVSAVSL
jgi:hypothetical protein